MRRIIILFIFSCCLCQLSIAAEGSLSSKRKQLQVLKQQIEALEQALNRSEDKRDVLMEALKSAEQKIGLTAMQLQSTQEKLQHQRRVLKRLQRQAQRQQDKLDQQQTLLSQQLRSAYQLGHHQYFKLLLNQENPMHLTRMFTYYSAINDARQALIKDVKETILRLHSSKVAIAAQAKKLEHLLDHQESQHQQLISQQDYHRTVLARLNETIENSQTRLSHLKTDKANLEQLVVRLHRQAQTRISKTPFANMQHRLSWPLHGKVVNHFGEAIHNSELTHNGILIKAAEGRAVHAVFPGKVVFADWLRGFGQLIIIDHGQGYLSLYAHNQSLYKHKGETVNLQERIASVGHSGGFGQNGLYFELRQNGKPLNPIVWFKRHRT